MGFEAAAEISFPLTGTRTEQIDLLSQAIIHALTPDIKALPVDKLLSTGGTSPSGGLIRVLDRTEATLVPNFLHLIFLQARSHPHFINARLTHDTVLEPKALSFAQEALASLILKILIEKYGDQDRRIGPLSQLIARWVISSIETYRITFACRLANQDW